jgi:mRNA interferase ChpB
MSTNNSPRRVPQRGDVNWIDPNPVSGGEMRDRHRFVVVTPLEINKLGVSITVPVTLGGAFARLKGLTMPLLGSDTTGVAVCSQARSFDIQARVLAGSARYIETLDSGTADEIVNRLVSVLEPG